MKACDIIAETGLNIVARIRGSYSVMKLLAVSKKQREDLELKNCSKRFMLCDGRNIFDISS